MERTCVTLEGARVGGCPGLEWSVASQLPVTADAQHGPSLELGQPVRPGGGSSCCV